MVLTNKYTQDLINHFPKFAQSNSLKNAIELFGDGENADASVIFIGLTNYIVDEAIAANKIISEEEIEIYKYIEEIRVKYSGFAKPSPEYEIDNAVCTCFLENLINRASAGRIEYSRFIPYLGEKSKEYCRAWDDYTGVKSPGL